MLLTRCPFPSDPFKIIYGRDDFPIFTEEYPNGIPPIIVQYFPDAKAFSCVLEGDTQGVDIVSRGSEMPLRMSNRAFPHPDGGYDFVITTDKKTGMPFTPTPTPDYKKEILQTALIQALWAFENAEIIETEPLIKCTKKVTKLPGKQARTSTVRLVTRRYEMRPPSTPAGPPRYITCERWGVRGHWRTYRSGRRVWIAPYEKGRGSKRKDTVYVT